MNRIQIIHDQPDSILVQGLSAILGDRNKLSTIATTSYNNLDPVIAEPDTIFVIFIRINADVEKIIAQLLQLSTADKSFVFIYLTTLEDRSIKALASFNRAAIVSALSSPDELVYYMEQVNKDNVILCMRTKDTMLQSIMRPNRKVDAFQFSSTEQAIITIASRGGSIVETADELQLSVHTIAAYRSKILKKSGFKSMYSLIAARNQ